MKINTVMPTSVRQMVEKLKQGQVAVEDLQPVLSNAEKRITLPCINRGAETGRSDCSGGPVYKCRVYGECTKNPCKHARLKDCKSCESYSLEPVTAWSMLITGGIGDVFALEAMLQPEQRDTLETIYYACPASKTISAAWAALPNYPNLKNHVILSDNKDVYVNIELARRKLNIPEGVRDWSIATIFKLGLGHVGSSWLSHRLASPDIPAAMYVIIVPLSEWGKWPNRNFDDQDWKRCLDFLESKKLLGVVLNGSPSPIPNHPRLMDLQGKTTLLESIELMKGAAGYLGIDSALSVLAAKLYPANRICVKGHSSHLDLWKHVYYSPRTEFPFIRKQLEAPSWDCATQTTSTHPQEPGKRS